MSSRAEQKEAYFLGRQHRRRMAVISSLKSFRVREDLWELCRALRVSSAHIRSNVEDLSSLLLIERRLSKAIKQEIGLSCW